MKVFISILCLMSLTLAEPPVGDGYAAAQVSFDDHHHDQASDHQRSLSQEYGPPSDTFASARNNPSTGYEYNPPNARSSSNARAQSQKHTPATVRVSFNQRFSSPAARNSAQGQKSFSQDYAAPNARSGISQKYGPPARSLSQEYGVPSVGSARTLSTEYGMPDARSTPSQEYGVPVETARSNQKPHSAASNFRRASERSNNAAPSFDTKPFPQSAPGPRSAPSLSYGTPTSRSQSPSHGVLSARNRHSQDYDSDSQTYVTPKQRDVSKIDAAPDAKGLSQEYGVPSSRASHMNDADSSSYASARSSPSSTYLPAARSDAPSDQYGVPEQRNGASLGYDNARARALHEELLNQEPANYDFGYQIEDQESGSDFGHTETREEDRAQGSYFVVRPDGSKQTVEYEADERGFRPRISVEPAAAAGGYDENAAEISSARSAAGPY